MEKYTWAVNKLKLQRAIKVLTDAAQLVKPFVAPTDAEIKAKYVQFAGLLLEDAPESVKEAMKEKSAGIFGAGKKK